MLEAEDYSKTPLIIATNTTSSSNENYDDAIESDLEPELLSPNVSKLILHYLKFTRTKVEKALIKKYNSNE